MPRPFSSAAGPAGGYRREPFTQRAWQWVKRGLWLSAAVGLLVGGYQGYRQAHRFIFQTDYFKIREIRISGASAELEQDARDWLADKFARSGDNLVALSGEVAGVLGRLPRARAATVRKIYPNALAIDFKEREPLMVVNLERPYLIDADGILLDELKTREMRRSGLPLLTGIKGEELRAGQKLEHPRLREILDAVAFIRESDEFVAARIEEWNINGRAEVTAIMKSGAEVRFGDQSPLDLLPKLSTALVKKTELEQSTYIDLRMDRQLVYK